MLVHRQNDLIIGYRLREVFFWSKQIKMSNLQTRLRQARKEAGLTQKEVCRLSGIKQPSYSDLENIEGSTSRYLVAIAQALGVRAEWLQNGKGPQRASYADDPAKDEEISWLWSQIAEEDRPLLIQMLRAAAQKK